MRKVLMMLFAAAVIVVGAGEVMAEEYQIFAGKKMVQRLVIPDESVVNIDHIRKIIKVDGRETILPKDATRIEFLGRHRGVMYLNITELAVRAVDAGASHDGDYFCYGFNKPLSMDEVIGIEGAILTPRWINRVNEHGSNEKGLFYYDDKRDRYIVAAGTKVEVRVSIMREVNGVRQIDVTKKTIDF